MGEGVERHEAAIAPSPDSDTTGIQLWITHQQLIERSQLVFELQCAKLLEDGRLKFAVASWRTTVIDREYREATSQQHLMKQRLFVTSAPLILHYLAGWSAVNVSDQWNFLITSARRKEEFTVQSASVLSLEFHKLRLFQIKSVAILCVPKRPAVASRVTRRHLRSGQHSGKIVHIMPGIIGKGRIVRAILAGNPRQVRAIELHRIEMLLPGIIFVANEIDRARCLIYSLHGKHFEIAACELVFQPGLARQRVFFIKAVEVNVRVPVSPACP